MALELQIAAIQFNSTVGALVHNREGLFTAYKQAVADGATLVVSPEFCTVGYPVEDLVLRASFLKAAREEIGKLITSVMEFGGNVPLIFGGPDIYDPSEEGEGDQEESDASDKRIQIYNAAYFVDPQWKSDPDTNAAQDVFSPAVIIHKRDLPNYGVFDEKRVFVAASESNVITWNGIAIGLMICEDAWKPEITNDLWEQGADIFISINGSPFEQGKLGVRKNIIRQRIRETGKPFVYVNAVGGQDELVFDGGSFMYDGEMQDAPQFKEGIFMFKTTVQTEPPDGDDVEAIPMENFPEHRIRIPIKETYSALVLGLRDYLNKQRFETVVLGYSGGVDSGLVAALACDAIGSENVHLVRMPSTFSSEGSLTDAANGAAMLGAHMRTIPIEPVVEALRVGYRDAVYDTAEEKRLEPGDDEYEAHMTYCTETECAYDHKEICPQAKRARGTILMAISNQEGHILLSTGNKSEVSVGYCTLYGDMNGGFNPLKDVYKSVVWALCKWRNAKEQHMLDELGYMGRPLIVVPNSIIEKPPSAELREGQKDEDSLPPYKILDFMLNHFIEEETSVARVQDILRKNGLEQYVDQASRIRALIDQTEYKRRQSAPGIKITKKIHGRDRRYPIVNHWRA
jgi:NAD+ synthase